MTTRSTHWKVYNWPGIFHAVDWYVNRPMTEREVRADLRAVWRVKRLPAGVVLIAA